MSQLPTHTVEIAFTGTDASPTWTDVSTYVQAISIRRGRTREVDQFNAGTASVILDNKDRRFDPEYASSPYVGNLLPMRPIRIKAAFNATTYTLFRGYVDQWPQAYDPPNIGRVTLTATDGFKILQRGVLDSAYAQQILADSPSHWWTLGDSTGTTAIDRTHTQDGTYIGGPTLGVASIVPGDPGTSVTFNGNKQYVSFAGANIASSGVAFELWFSMPTVGTADQVLISGTPSAALTANTSWLLKVGGTTGGSPGLLTIGSGTVATSSVRVDDSKVHHVVADWNGHVLYLDGSSVGSFTVPGTQESVSAFGAGYAYPGVVTLGFSGTMQHIATYSGGLTSTKVANHYSAGLNAFANETSGTRVGRILDWVGWDSSLRSIDAGEVTIEAVPSSQRGQAALDALHDVDNTEGGQLYMSADGKLTFRELDGPIADSRSLISQATFGDSTGELPYTDIQFDFDDTLLRNYVTTTRNGGAQQIASDSASITTYGTMSYSRPTTLEVSDTAAYSAAQRVVALYKDVKTRVSQIVVNGESSANGKTPTDIYPQILGREIGDRITVKRRPQGVGSAITKDVLIEGIQHDADPSKWITTFQLSPIPTYGNVTSTNWLILNDSTYGKVGTGVLY